MVIHASHCSRRKGVLYSKRMKYSGLVAAIPLLRLFRVHVERPCLLNLVYQGDSIFENTVSLVQYKVRYGVVHMPRSTKKDPA